ncbi:MAG: hypothetical protein US40_C0004G0029 [Candidatus Roizmanbacteria bacterium GW2011_GWC2_37_13]|uniref:Uncharacterized protein n=1 Tax=Candidatus Roizmanbacteria bacterium GW2011_GWC2_37_13 TaxID=1618486 RepID=A0A0G0IP87_9BACT|nr:MAG: hypothetical protein US38_C0001G0016 [Candidatus Roizmanbacteria bacterium GW2011_GWC1_37_12]KKQ25994.1 MAG: hypothetical protein US40_C0004G0029 [Candidatus Roizmanbacteria bacterium GW2011_GWC2_37_13]
MLDSAVEGKSPTAVSMQEPSQAIHESPLSAIHPDMKDRATPLEGTNPGAKEAQRELEQMIRAAAGEKPDSLEEVKIGPEIKSEKKSQSFLARIWDSIKNFFNNLLR